MKYSSTQGIPQHDPSGEKVSTILKYFGPELITASLYAFIKLMDCYFIANLTSSCPYTALGYSNMLFQFLTKIAEGFGVGIIIICGQYNGIGEYKKIGHTVADVLWTTLVIGAIIAFILYSGAYWIYAFYGLPEEIVSLGIPFLRLRALSIFFIFIFFSLTGFLRSIKNTRAPMYFYLTGAILFIFFDYALIYGKWGFPALGLQGSALAGVIYNGSMLILALIYIFSMPSMRKFDIRMWRPLNMHTLRHLASLSWPVMIDKAMFAVYFIWLAKMMSFAARESANQTAFLASFIVIKDLVSVAILPGVAFTPIMTFLASNDLKVHNWEGIKNNIKKVLLLAASVVSWLLLIIILWPSFFIQLFDKCTHFTLYATSLLPIMAPFVFFDLGQLILSAALRGTGNVKTVMLTRSLIGLCFFIPASYFITRLPNVHTSAKFILIYGSFYVGTLLMSLIYASYFKRGLWKHHALHDPHKPPKGSIG